MKTSHLTRRQTIKHAAFASFGLLGCARKSRAETGTGLVIGSGAHRYEVIHDWVRLPDKYTWQTTHNVAVDKAGNLYVIHEGRHELREHPAIFVFDPEGRFIRAFGQMFQGGGHGLEVREEEGREFLYVTGYQMLKTFAKLTLTGELVWQKFAPMQSGLYAAGENTQPEKIWGRDRFMPTNFAFLPDGGFFLADGYGAWVVHRYDKDGNWLSQFGVPGQEDGQLSLPHGIWIDDRPGGDPSIVVADRSNARLQWFTLDGKHLRTMTDFILPANIDRRGDWLLVPDLASRITLLDKDNQTIHLGEDPGWRQAVTADKNKMRTEPARWVSGRFIHPHDACFDANGNIFVAEWVATGRISKLRKLD